MRRFMGAEIDKQKFLLKQMGAQVEVINSFMCYVTFNVKNTEIAYCYNVNKKGDYFLERIKPYPEVAGTFKSEEDVINIIYTDIEQFKNATESHDFSLFIDINKKVSKSVREFEDLYLYYNVPHEYTEEIKKKIDEIQKLIKKAKSESKRVYFKTEPKALEEK
ncbi:hypothetical protein [Sporosalibacterium faouarense]|uniref:hypothetical protein n=1 Tax=Sporosalibacterium faouarense TaxID=516123 RepID=UPI00141C1685|nr:hypothetical protein [Sporosalibacterium faouarense]MTI47617.1 ATP-binding protein [Bacillota bacterium]